MDDFRKRISSNFRPGGYHCQCCGPKPDEKPYWRRQARRLLKKDLFEEIETQNRQVD